MTRRLRKFPQHHPSEGEPQHSTGRRMPYGLMWLVLTVIVFVLVILYDRQSINAAEQHIANGRELERKGLYVDALTEYGQAFENRRLGRKAKAEVALGMAEIYFKHLEDYPSAHKYYVRAKQEAPGVFAEPKTQEHARIAETRAKGAGIFKSRNNLDGGAGTTATIVQRVELISEPMSDKQGPVLARYNGGEIHAGQVLRELRHRPEFYAPDFRESPEKLRDYVQGVLKSELSYQAAVSAGVHKDPDVSTRLYDYQKQLISQRYLVDRHELAMRVDNAAVENYYNQNKSEFVKPGNIQLAMIKAPSETSATELLQMVRSGVPFRDVATSYSADEASRNVGGSVGVITEGESRIAGIGEVPDVVSALFQLQVHSVSDVVEVNGSHYIFRIAEVTPAVNTTLDEARGRIENILRGRQVDTARFNLDTELNDAFEPALDEDTLKQFWQYAQENTRVIEAVSTGSMTVSGDAATSATPENIAPTTATEAAAR